MSRRHYKTRYPKRRRYKRGSGKGGSYIKFLLATFGILLAIAVVTLGTMFVLEAFFRIDTPLRPDGLLGQFAAKFHAPLVESPTPVITPEPTPTPYPMDEFDGLEQEHELVFPGEFNYAYLGDPYCFGGRIICSAGKLVDGDVRMLRLVEYEIATGSVKDLPIEPINDHLMFPVFNENWLCWFDAHASVGGGHICAMERGKTGSEPFIIKEVYIGQPQLSIYENYVTWIERTGSERDKIFICDLSTQETTVVETFNKSAYGLSIPTFGGGKLVWAAEETGNTYSMIRTIGLDGSPLYEYKPGTYIHDPQFNGKYYAWLNAPHSDGVSLYLSDGMDVPFVLAKNVTGFGLSDKFIAYGVDEAVYIYVFENQKTYRISPERELTQFLGVSDGTIIWMDVTSRERDIIKYAIPPV